MLRLIGGNMFDNKRSRSSTKAELALRAIQSLAKGHGGR